MAHIQEARQALTGLREEHERQRQERLQEEQRIRQQQMQFKLEQVRQKKHVSSISLFIINLFLGASVATASHGTSALPAARTRIATASQPGRLITLGDSFYSLKNDRKASTPPNESE